MDQIQVHSGLQNLVTCYFWEFLQYFAQSQPTTGQRFGRTAKPYGLM